MLQYNEATFSLRKADANSLILQFIEKQFRKSFEDVKLFLLFLINPI